MHHLRHIAQSGRPFLDSSSEIEIDNVDNHCVIEMTWNQLQPYLEPRLRFQVRMELVSGRFPIRVFHTRDPKGSNASSSTSTEEVWNWSETLSYSPKWWPVWDSSFQIEILKGQWTASATIIATITCKPTTLTIPATPTSPRGFISLTSTPSIASTTSTTSTTTSRTLLLPLVLPRLLRRLLLLLLVLLFQ